ncbi:NAD-binding protein [candidate division KSB1 bacterium]|nr:NAD-binding protein [candidate division KSB1 bacterium]
MNTVLKVKVRIALLLILAVIIVGTIGYMTIEGWGLLNSIYMTVITISTVGFSEVNPLTPTGRLLTMILIVLGIGIGGYTIGNLSVFLLEGHIQNIIRGRRMQRNISSLKNHIIVCGFGRTGTEIVEELNNDDVDLLIVDNDDSRIAEAQDQGLLVVAGNATDDDVLRKCNVENAKGLIATLGNDADNLFIVLSAREMNKTMKIIVRGVDETSTRKFIRAGADNVVSPFSIAGRRMATLVTKPQIVEFLEVMMQSGEFELKIEQVVLGEKSALVGTKLNQSNIKSRTDGASVIGIKKGEDGEMIVNPCGDTVLERNDILIVLGNTMQIDLLKGLAEK